MSAEENKRLMRRFIEEFWNGKRMEVADELFAPHATSPNAPWAPPGPEGVKFFGNMMFTAFPDFRMTIDRIVASGNKVAARYVESGTHRGEFMGIAPTGKKVTWTEIGILRIEDGKVVESWFETDMLGLMQQLGAIPAPGGD
jgi:predicted ester cyclase